jgi:hypothetical protein
MHNPGRPVRGGPGGPGGEMSRLKGLPQHCPGRSGWEGLQGQQRSSDHVHTLDRAEITGHLQPHPLPYMAGHPPKDNSAGSAQSTLTQLHTQTITHGPEFSIVHTNDAKGDTTAHTT